MIAYLGVVLLLSRPVSSVQVLVEQYHRKSSISDWGREDIKEIAEVMVDSRLAGKCLEDVEEEGNTKVYLILRDNLSILPQKDTELQLGDVLILRDETIDEN